MEAAVNQENGDLAERASDFLLGVLERMGVSADIDVREEADKVVLDIQTKDAELIIGRRGVVIDALQHLVNKVVYRERSGERGERNGERGERDGERGERGKPLVIDAGGFRDKQVERLRTLAQRMSERALTNQEIVELQPMTPHDRRIVHMAIAEIAGLSSRSEGEGDDRHILLVPDALAQAD